MNKVLVKVARIAKLLLRDKQPALLSTISINGWPRARYMGACRVRAQGEFFLISPGTANKIKEIQNNPRAQLIFTGKGFQKVLTLSGKATVVRDEALRRSLYEEKALKLYPVFDDYFGVIQFMPGEAEYLDLQRSNEPVRIIIHDNGKK